MGYILCLSREMWTCSRPCLPGLWGPRQSATKTAQRLISREYTHTHCHTVFHYESRIQELSLDFETQCHWSVITRHDHHAPGVQWNKVQFKAAVNAKYSDGLYMHIALQTGKIWQYLVSHLGPVVACRNWF